MPQAKSLSFVIKKINRIVTHGELVMIRRHVLAAYHSQFDQKIKQGEERPLFVEAGHIAEFSLRMLEFGLSSADFLEIKVDVVLEMVRKHLVEVGE